MTLLKTRKYSEAPISGLQISYNKETNISKQPVYELHFKIGITVSYRKPCCRSIDRQSQEKKGEQN